MTYIPCKTLSVGPAGSRTPSWPTSISLVPNQYFAQWLLVNFFIGRLIHSIEVLFSYLQQESPGIAVLEMAKVQETYPLIVLGPHTSKEASAVLQVVNVHRNLMVSNSHNKEIRSVIYKR